jgi:hypothetical protein
VAEVPQVRLYLGVDVGWLNRPEMAGTPRCVSRNRLAGRRSIQRANGPILIDSGAFTELKTHGRWRITPAEYVAEVRRYVAAIGPDNVVAVGPMDWMCESVVIDGGVTKDGRFAGTRAAIGMPDASLDECIAEHQRRTVANYLELRALAPDLPIMPVLQGSTLDQYLRCVDMYRTAGVELRTVPLVGLGSVCRRQASDEIDLIVTTLESLGMSLHGFGVKSGGLAAYGPLLTSADSMAWSYGARKRGGRCVHGLVRWETNCPAWAAAWWRRTTARINCAQPALDLWSAVMTVTATWTRPTCDTCRAVYTPTGPYWDGTNDRIDAMARAAGWGIAVGVTHGGRPYAAAACPTCRRGGA